MMKKSILLVIMISILFLLSGCGDSNKKLVLLFTKASFSGMNFIVQNQYGDKISKLNYETNNNDFSKIFFVLKNSIEVNSKTQIKDTDLLSSKVIQSVDIISPLSEQYVNDIVVCANDFYSESNNKALIKKAFEDFFKNDLTKTKIDLGPNSYIENKNNQIHLSMSEEFIMY